MADDSFAPLRSFDAFSPRGLAGKREYVQGLEQRGDAEACALLVACLTDESGYLRDLAADALVRLRVAPGPVFPMLASGLWYTRVSAARTLGRLAAQGSAGPLSGLLDDTNQSVRRSSCLERVKLRVEILIGGRDARIPKNHCFSVPKTSQNIQGCGMGFWRGEPTRGGAADSQHRS